MYIVDRKTKQTNQIEEVTFKDLWLKERKDLQERIANNPFMLWEDLLIIQKEFDWFSNTNERLDLLALDLNWNIVVIENKLDDSWRDVVWQAMKYAWYCSSLKKNDIRTIYQEYLDKIWNSDKNAEQEILDFLGKDDWTEVQLNKDLSQRIILVAREFRREVTNTVIWARKYWIKIQCIKITPYRMWEEFFVDTDQIIPVKDIQDIMISYDEKAHEDMQEQEHLNNSRIIWNEFWRELLPKFNKKSDLFSWRSTDSNNNTDNWFDTWAWISWIYYVFRATTKYAAVELSMRKNHDMELNKSVYDFLFTHKDEIEKTFWCPLIWERLDWKIMCRLSYKLEWVNILNKEDWDNMMEFLIEYMIKFEKSLRPHIEAYKRKR